MYCTNCKSEEKTALINKAEVYSVKGEDVSIEATVCVCKKCGNEIWNEEVDGANLRSAYCEYRKRHDLLQPDEIRKIRLMYGVSQTTFARILGFGDKTITRYENGSIQDAAQNNLITLMKNPQNFDELLEKSKSKLTQSEYRIAKEVLESMSVRIAYSKTSSIDYCVTKPRIYWKNGGEKYA